jgi:hypothetical protein
VGTGQAAAKLADMAAGGKVRPGDVNAGDVITLPGDDAGVCVRAVRLGPGGFQLTVGPPGCDGPEGERAVTLTAREILIRHR